MHSVVSIHQRQKPRGKGKGRKKFTAIEILVSLSMIETCIFLALFGKGDGKYGIPSVSTATLNTNRSMMIHFPMHSVVSIVNPPATKTTRERKGLQKYHN